MFIRTKLCIPTPVQREWIRESHKLLGHVGFGRLWKMMANKYERGDVLEAGTFAKQVAAQCETCQACVRPQNKFGPIVSSTALITMLFSIIA